MGVRRRIDAWNESVPRSRARLIVLAILLIYGTGYGVLIELLPARPFDLAMVPLWALATAVLVLAWRVVEEYRISSIQRKHEYGLMRDDEARGGNR